MTRHPLLRYFLRVVGNHEPLIAMLLEHVGDDRRAPEMGVTSLSLLPAPISSLPIAQALFPFTWRCISIGLSENWPRPAKFLAKYANRNHAA
jgi:hypothetical protein